MMVWEEEETMEEKVVDQVDSNNLEDTEVTNFNALPSRVLGNLGESIPKHREIWEGAGPIQQPRQRLVWSGHMTVQQQSESGGRVGVREQYQGQSRAYVQNSMATSSGGVSTGQNKVADERTTVSSTTVAASSGTTLHVQIGSSSKTELVGRKSTLNDNLICNKCGKKGHISKDCTEEIECVNCGKGHQSMICAWLKQKKPTANLVGFGGPGL
jgi:hypothetical protein